MAKLISTTLLGPDTLFQAKGAIDSVSRHVFAHLLVFAPKERADAERLADEMHEPARVFHLHEEPWRNFSHARNVSLSEAAKLGYHWALTLDTDERVSLPESVHADLDASPFPTLMVPADDEHGGYLKERLFRLPAEGAWRGPTHECYLPISDGNAILEGASFRELPRSEEALKAKLLRDVSLLYPFARKHPKDPRWWFYLGRTLKDLGRTREAIGILERSYSLDGWQEESAISGYWIAECHAFAKEWRQAIEWAARALARAPWMPEPAYLAAVCNLERAKTSHALQREQYLYDAIAWANLALTHAAGRHGRRRGSFQNLTAQWEGPYEVLRVAWTELGYAHKAEVCAIQAQDALARRMGYTVRPRDVPTVANGGGVSLTPA
jgi:tetratricopeptide (TPR) repeat protein